MLLTNTPIPTVTVVIAPRPPSGMIDFIWKTVEAIFKFLVISRARQAGRRDNSEAIFPLAEVAIVSTPS